MKQKKPELSVIIVHYKVLKELLTAVESVYTSKVSIPFEIIVVDNDEEKSIQKELRKKYPGIIYIPNNRNTGWGEGSNEGVRHAKGKYLYFLNPDTVVYPYAITKQYNFLKEHNNAGIVSSLLIDKEGNPYTLQGTRKLTPLSAIFAISIINKFFPNNPVSRHFWLKDWTKKENKEIEVVPLSSAIISKELFEKAGGFDKNFFLYFEEYDLSQRIKNLGYKNYIITDAHVQHLWGVSSKKRDDIQKIFSQSRYYYFKKYYGVLLASIIEKFLSVSKIDVLLSVIIFLGIYLRFYALNTLMMFIGDFGWFFLSARDFILTGIPPLIGITASHPWLHQGPLWTYLLSISLLLGNFNPVSGGYLAAGIGVLTLCVIFYVVSRMFNQKIAILTTFLYATSPLVIIHSRMPYHTSPIPLFTIFYIYAMWKWVKGNKNYFPLIVVNLALLYNLELASISLFFYLLVILVFGFFKKKEWVLHLFNKKVATLTAVAFFVPMLPVLLYDLTHGFQQTIIFGGWLGYKALQFVHVIPSYSVQVTVSWESINAFLLQMIQRLLFLPNTGVAVTLLLSSIVFAFWKIVMVKKNNSEYSVILGVFIALSLGFLIAKTPSEAYMPFFFPVIILFVGLLFSEIMKYRRFHVLAVIIIIFIGVGNSTDLVSQQYLMDIPNGYGLSYVKRLSIAKKIITESSGKPYALIGNGNGSQYQSFLDNYRYLTWWMGNNSSQNKEKIIFTITETATKVDLKKETF